MESFIHKPVLLREVVANLLPAPGKLHVDGTIGGGGHAEAMLETSGPTGRLVGFDRDRNALAAAAERLLPFEGRFELHHANFADMLNYLEQESCDSVLLDLGVSSPQLDHASRGFSFQSEGPLDMRMDQSSGETAADIVNNSTPEELADIFWTYGEERNSRKIARAIEMRRKLRPFSTTKELAEFIAKEFPRGGQKIHPATRIFQALRIEVNQELNSLDEGLEASWQMLKRGGRLGVITFHSLEDRIVKQFGRMLARDYTVEGEVDLLDFRTPTAPRAELITRKPIKASEQEEKENPRARSAQLRVLQKL